jgi:hypothetical protein
MGFGFREEYPMPEHRNSPQRTTNRILTWTMLVIVPALAIVALGTGLSFTGGPAVPAGLQVAETRDFAAQGDAVTATAKPAEQGSIADFADTWQNTVRVPPSPRR